jgi:glutathione synthase
MQRSVSPPVPQILFVMDPIERIHVRKDSTFAMLLECQRRGWPTRICGPGDLYVLDGRPFAVTTALRVFDDPQRWF